MDAYFVKIYKYDSDSEDANCNDCEEYNDTCASRFYSDNLGVKPLTISSDDSDTEMCDNTNKQNNEFFDTMNELSQYIGVSGTFPDNNDESELESETKLSMDEALSESDSYDASYETESENEIENESEMSKQNESTNEDSIDIDVDRNRSDNFDDINKNQNKNVMNNNSNVKPSKNTTIEAKAKVIWPKPSVVTKRVDFNAFMNDWREAQLSILVCLKNIMERNLVFDQRLTLYAKIFDWEAHIDEIKRIKLKNKNNGSNEFKKYIIDFGRVELIEVVKLWNQANEKYSNLVFELKKIDIQYILLKSRFVFFYENGSINSNFNQSKEMFKKEYNIKISLHNEIGRQLLFSNDINQDCGELLAIWTHVEVMGAVQGRVEGDVRGAKELLRNKYSLSAKMFGFKYSIKSMSDALPHLKQIVLKRACVEWYDLKGSPFLKAYPKNYKYPSPTLFKLMRKKPLPVIAESDKDKIPTLASIESFLQRENARLSDIESDDII